MRIEEIGVLDPFEAFDAIRGMPLPFIFSWETEPGARLTYVGADPSMTIKTIGVETIVCAEGRRAGSYRDPFTALSEVMPGLMPPERGPFPFNSGVAGYFSYDLKDVLGGSRRRADVPPRRDSGMPQGAGAALSSESLEWSNPPCGTEDPIFMGGGLGLPECLSGIYDPVFVYDHSRGMGFLVSHDASQGRCNDIRRALIAKARDRGKGPGMGATGTTPGAGFTSNVTRDEYLDAIRKAQGYIEAGDIYQVNLSHRLQTQWEGDPFRLFKALVNGRGSRFSSYMDMGPFQIISNSPERLLRVMGRAVETSPIKGTRPRGATPEDDLALVRALRLSEKERAEHVMIVDLERNDIGMISEPGTVEVSEFEAIKTFPSVHHMVSTVRGTLRRGLSPYAALGCVFPGGSVTGAPKSRAIEVIDELERAPRGVYTGGIGLMDLSGDLDVSMAIRTAVAIGGRLYLSVGGGIVADSVPEEEYSETIVKADDFLMALGGGAHQVTERAT
jgi:para-aminobenzoate synthetase component 1